MMKSLSIEVVNHIGVVTFNNPPVNAVNYRIYKELQELFEQINTMDGIRVVIFRAEGKRFCAGNDIKELGTFANNPELTRKYLQVVSDSISSVYTCRVPVIMSVQGPVIGAGLGIAACGDLIVASDDAFFGVPEIKAGIIGAAGFAKLLVPEKICRYMAYTGNTLTAHQLYHYGSIHNVVPLEKLDATAMELAAELLKSAPIALRYYKEAMNFNANERLAEKYGIEMEYSARNVLNEDFKEGIDAFFEKRNPVWKAQ